MGLAQTKRIPEELSATNLLSRIQPSEAGRYIQRIHRTGSCCSRGVDHIVSDIFTPVLFQSNDLKNLHDSNCVVYGYADDLRNPIHRQDKKPQVHFGRSVLIVFATDGVWLGVSGFFF